MALTREFLKELGIEGDNLEKVMSEYGKTHSELTELQSQVTNLTSENEALTSKVKERDESISKLGDEAGTSQKLKDQIAQLQADSKSKDEAWSNKLTKAQTDNAVKLALINANVHDPNDLMSQLDMSIVKLDDDGKVKGLDEQVSALKESKAYLFKTDDQTQNNNQPVIKPGAGGNPSGAGGDNDSIVSRIAAHLNTK
ncbi:phage scaffolding protein [Lactiplantibacillus fabifermentans]|uniref:Scaffolding protein n=1 Tax=Lactiplantibacillus fabifermentans DSM 21115 TaxID=1413187 RepID=A0A0R2NSU5_9LACO|nr:phage scaffolding protein [Lactiplantibacillus fabifermentans]KRO28460.1 hypothetical protein DY78_GL002359 [Lactiplantibacillus fabifermentans DSM 21115]